MTKSIQSNENIFSVNPFKEENEYNEHERKLIETYRKKRKNLDSIQQKLDDGTEIEEMQQHIEGLEKMKPWQENGLLKGFVRALFLKRKRELTKELIEILKHFSDKKKAPRPLVA